MMAADFLGVGDEIAEAVAIRWLFIGQESAPVQTIAQEQLGLHPGFQYQECGSPLTA